MRDRLERALREQGNLYSLGDIVQRIEDGRMQSFVRGDSWIVTQINNYPQLKAIDVVIGCGEMDDIMFLENDLSRFGRNIAADRIIMNGRPGWLKMQELFDDWKMVGYRYSKELGDGRS